MNIRTIITIILALLLAGCNTGREREALIPRDKMNFAFHTHIFGFRIIINGDEVTGVSAATSSWALTHPLNPDFDPFFTELVFVHTEAEAQNFPDNVIVAWPLDRPLTEISLNRFNNIVSRTEAELVNPRDAVFGREPIILEEFGLTYPITVVDLIDNWEKVIAVWNALTESERDNFR